ncbi:MAG: glycoside hydrolase family 2 TIM barrel-domain containing protein [Puniceicoccaceae bacterium]
MKAAIILFLSLPILIFSGCSSSLDDKPASASGVQKLMIDGEPYTIKGVCYHPVPKGSRVRSFDRLDEDLILMQEAGINTIRVYEPITDRSVLDAIAAAGVRVIISIGYNQGGEFDILSGTFADYIREYKDHKAILLWELGNEYNYHPDWFGGDIQNWYDALDAAAVLAKQIDPTRPVATAHGELPDKQALESCPNIDVWGMNVYRWDDPEGIFIDWPKISNKPIYLSEAGADSYMANDNEGYAIGSNEKAQADAMRAILEDIARFPEVSSGVAIFAFVDEWWKDEEGTLDTQDVGGKPPPAGFPYDAVANEEYWGILTIDREPKEAYSVVREFFVGDRLQ